MRLSQWVSCAGIITLLAAGATMAAPAADPVKRAGLTRVGAYYVLGDETSALADYKSLKTAKVEADSENRQRTVIDYQIAEKQKTIEDTDGEWHVLEARQAAITDARIHNNVVLRMNRLVAQNKEASLKEKELEKQAGNLSIEAKTKFVDELASVDAKVNAALARYKSLAGNAALKAEILRLSAATPQPAALGPTPELVAAAEQLKKWQSEVDSEAIPLHEDHGIQKVDALLNGQQFSMDVDTGSSSVCLPGEVAEKIGLHPGEHDAVVQLKLANGSTIQGHEMVLKTVRVGRFTAQNVPCVVLDKGLADAPNLLGASFLNHFVVKLDPAAHELRLTAITPAGHKPASAAPAKRPDSE